MRKLLIFWTIFAFCMSTVSALQISSPVLGGSSAFPGDNVTATFTVTNDGSQVLSNIVPSWSGDSKYKISFTNIPQSLAPGASASVTIKGVVPNDFAEGKRSIGTVTVTGSYPATIVSGPTLNITSSANVGAQLHFPQLSAIPVGMSATNDCGTNTQTPIEPIIGQWHTGTCDWTPDIEVMQPFNGSVDAGWARLHSDKYMDYWVNAVSVDCNGQASVPPSGWDFGGKIHTGPGLCDGQIELPSGDSGWMGFYSKPTADGKLILVIADDKCGGASAQQVPATGVILGRVRTGPNTCNGQAEAVSYTGASIDAGAMYVVYLPNVQSPSNKLPIGVFESLTSTGLSGWAYDENAPSINVQVKVDGVFWKDLAANQPRADLVTSNKTPDANHGFSYTFTAADKLSLDFSKNHTFAIYAINSPVGDNPQLNGSPKTLLASTNGSTGGNTSAGNTASATVYMEAGNANKLKIDKVKINCGTKTETVDSNDKIEDILPGMNCELTVKVKNTGDLEIEDVEIEAETDSNDVDGDSVDISSIDKKDSEEDSLELTVDDEADDGSVKVTITVTGTDTKGVKHKDTFTFTLKIERAKHDLPIAKIAVAPKPADRCVDKQIQVKVYVENKGRNDEKKVAVELSVPALSFNKKVTDIRVDQDDEEFVLFTIPVSAKTPFGSFKATAKSFYDNVAEINSKEADIIVSKCDDEETPVVPSKDNGPVVTPPPRVDDVVVIPPAKEDVKSGLGSNLLLGVLILANLIALTVLGVMGYNYFKNKSADDDLFVDEKSLDETFEKKEYY